MARSTSSTPVHTGTGSSAKGAPGRWIALGVLTLSVLLVAIDATVLGLAIPFLSEDLEPTGTQLLWIGDVYSFVIAGLLVTAGSVGDRIGRKKLLLWGSAAFGALSVVAAYAPSAEALIAARVAMGVAGATLMPSTLALVRNIFPDARERSFAIGVWGAMSMAGAAFGPVVGGFLLEHFWWGSVFLINLPVMAVLIAVGIKLLPESKNPDPGPFDIFSAALSLVGMIATVYAVKEAAAHGVMHWQIPLAAVVGVGALVWFGRRQLSLPVPLLDMRLFRNRAFSGSVLADLLTVLGLSGALFFLSQFLQLVQSKSPLQAGLAEMPATAGAIVSGLLAGVAARRLSPRVVVTGGLTSIGLALGALTVLSQDTPYLYLGGALLLIGVGAGFSFTVTADLILGSAPKENAGSASAVSETAYELGAALGIALLGSVITGVYRSAVTVPAEVSNTTADGARESLAGAVEAARATSGQAAADLTRSANDAFLEGLRIAAGAGAVVLLAAAVAAWFMLRGANIAASDVEH
ncbi:MFS transporter [Streptomyces sp. SID3343]|uniref:MFS transporter n=1 Tax=Streptomyces sp. SID3343 TaxID=2690260 RepID=UPI001371B0E3|nr:MFS transporter [Streptomyces sp. SID3343]MYV97983.1 MFS transporter [Streptomyces sp. SID3343]